MIMSVMLAAVVGGMTGCGGKKKSAAVPAIDVANMDLTVAPGTDFYRYANGGWMERHPLPADKSRFGSFDQLRDVTLDQIKTILDDLGTKEHLHGTDGQKVGTFYALGMDSVKRNAQGAEPIRVQLGQIMALSNEAEMAGMIATLHKEAIYPYFAFYVDADEMNSSMNMAILYQAGLGMGDRDYYLESDGDTRIRDAYETLIKNSFTLAGFDAEETATAVKAVMDIEKRIAEASYSREVMRDSYKNYNKMKVSEFAKVNKMIDWNSYFNAVGLEGDWDINVKQKDFYAALEKSLANVSLEDQKYYLAFNLIRDAAPYLSDDFAENSFDFYGRVLSGQEQMQPRWKRVLSTTDSALSEVLGKLYVERYFPASSKEKMVKMIDNLQVALGERINELEWMTDETKAKAQEKLATFYVKVGYPDKWRDYSALDIEDDSYWANVRRSNIFEVDYMMADINKPVDKTRWFMSPQTVNAYYNPTTNEICFPAGILQPPFFNADADDAVNYGAIGVVIGHEMTHGFDDQGRNYDKDGNLNDWWNAVDAERFEERANKLVEQFNAIEVAPGVYANGEYTLGENIADQGGLIVSYLAYENSLKGKSRPESIDGFTDAQRFYIGYAGVWGQNIRPEEILRLTKADVHSLGEYRVNATLRNIDDFYTAFGIVEGQPMWLAPEKRVLVW